MKSSLKVKVAIFLPRKGVVQKKDKKTIETLTPSGKRYQYAAKWGLTKQEIISCFKGKLSKEYDVIIITDKQFGMTKDIALNGVRNSILDIATTKQRNEMFRIN